MKRASLPGKRLSLVAFALSRARAGTLTMAAAARIIVAIKMAAIVSKKVALIAVVNIKAEEAIARASDTAIIAVTLDLAADTCPCYY